jgi:hypothetical protein
MLNLEEHINAFNSYLVGIRRELKEALTARNIKIENDKISDLLKCLLTFDSVPTGTVIASYARTPPNGYLLCDGAQYNKSEYPNLFNCIKGSNSTETTFNVPNLQGKFIQGKMPVESVGNSKEAGLPNITGTLMVDDSMYSQPNNYYTGAFTQGKPFGQWDLHSQGGGYSSGWINFSASSSNPIYGKSTTVQPPAICLNYYIKY